MQHVFPLGTIVISPSATEALAADQQTVSTLLARHGQGDWGLFPFQANEQALRRQHPLTSVYPLTDGTHIIVITNAERTQTRLLINKEIPSQEVSALEGYAMWASFYEKNSLIAVEERFVDTMLAPLKPKAALDVGTGTGRHALKLARRGIAVSAVDQSPEMLALARSRAEEEGLPIQFHQVSLSEGLPFVQGQFDLVISALMLSHLSDVKTAIHECCRVVTPGGYLLITDLHPAASDYGWRTAILYAGVRYVLPNPHHTREEYLDALTQAGFTLEHILDIPTREVPAGYLSDDTRHNRGDRLLCFVLLAHRPG